MPTHPRYEPSAAFIERHGLYSKYIEPRLYLSDTSNLIEVSKCLVYRPDTGEIILNYWDKDKKKVIQVFQGYLPTEEALEQVIAYTRW